MKAIGTRPPPDLKLGLAICQHGLQHCNGLVGISNLLPIDGKKQIPLTKARKQQRAIPAQSHQTAPLFAGRGLFRPEYRARSSS